jgi:hypothetical protein
MTENIAPMGRRTLAAFAMLCAGLALTSPAGAREPFDDVYFVRHGGVGADMLKDRAACSYQAQNLGSTAAAYSDPEYGALSAMSQELDSDALHDDGLRKRLYRAVFVDCMKRRGWAQLDPTPDEARSIGHASQRHPEALDAWIKTHEPPAPAPAPAPAPPPAHPAPAPAATVPASSASPTPAGPH